MAGSRSAKMAAVYTVSIEGIAKTRAAVAAVDKAIRTLRSTNYTTATSTTIAASLSNSKFAIVKGDLLVTKLDDLEGRVQGSTVKAMDYAMKRGKEYQTYSLATAITPTGLSGYGKNPDGRRGPGRDDTGKMIDSIITNVEIIKQGSRVQVTGFHGWIADDRDEYFQLQEGGTRHITPANSIGQAIIPTTEDLKRELGKLKR